MKQQLVSYWHLTLTFLKTPSSRLALSYLAIIMLMSIGFSVVFFHASALELGRQIPPPSTFSAQKQSGARYNTDSPDFSQFDDRRGAYRRFFEQRITEGRQHLIGDLIIINAIILAAGTILSYYLARRTLQPIERNMDAQTQFVSDASHELRTPLTAMQTSNEVALRRAKITDPQARQIITDNIQDIVRLRALTDGLLRLARQDTLQVQVAPVLLSDAVGDAINNAMAAASAKHITIDDKVGKVSALAEPNMLSQIITILLDNAVKYSPENSTVTVSAEPKGKHVQLHVADRGMGISESELPHIFDRFYRASTARTITTQDGEASGHGLGLSIAQKIAGQIGAELSVRSEPGKGSTFTVRLAGM